MCAKGYRVAQLEYQQQQEMEIDLRQKENEKITSPN